MRTVCYLMHWQKMNYIDRKWRVSMNRSREREREMWPTYIKGAQNCTHTKNNNVITHLLIHYVVVSSVFIFLFFFTFKRLLCHILTAYSPFWLIKVYDLGKSFQRRLKLSNPLCSLFLKIVIKYLDWSHTIALVLCTVLKLWPIIYAEF